MIQIGELALYNEDGAYVVVKVIDNFEYDTTYGYTLEILKVLGVSELAAIVATFEVGEVFRVSQQKLGGYAGSWYIRSMDEAATLFSEEELAI